MISKSPFRLAFAALIGFLVIALSASAASAQTKIFLNGVDITGVNDQTFEGANVTIDSMGNVLINAPQYKVEVQGESGQADPPAQSDDSYFLVVNNSNPGKVQYELDLYVNSALIKTVKDTQSQVVIEVSDKIVNGQNTIKIDAKKVMGTSRMSASKNDAIDIMLGKGSEEGNQLKIERQYVSFKVDASQTSDMSEEFSFDVK